MIKTKTIFSIFILSLSGFTFLISGCSDDNKDVIAPSDEISSLIVSVYPTEGATNVSTSASLSITFSHPMDTSSVMQNFYYSGGDEMHRWMDSLSHHNGMSGMGGNGMLNMDHMINWMDSIQIHGQFSWNETFDSCQFILDSTMMPNTEYMMFMYEGGMHNRTGGMMHMNQNDDGYHQYNFSTGQ